METLLVAALAIVVGLVVAGYGTRLFYFLLPLWGLLTGFVLGADLVANLLGEGLLASVLGWVAGGVLGLVFAAVAGLWFYGSVLILGIGLGVSVGSGLVAAIGISSGLLTLLGGVAVGAVVGVLVILTDAPTLLVAAVTGYAGATWLATGAMLLLGRVHLTDLHNVGAAGALRGDVLAVVIAFGVGTISFAFQALDMRARHVDTLRRDGYRF